jgi:hypothetical protein
MTTTLTTCPGCSKQLPNQIHFCPYCGVKVQSRPRLAMARFDWSLLGRWALATCVAWALAWVVLTHPTVNGWLAQINPPAARVMLGVAAAGIIMAVAQWLAMRGGLQRAGSHRGLGWLLALPGGLLIGAGVYWVWPALTGPGGSPLAPLAGNALRVALIAAVAALAEWPLARQVVAWSYGRRWVTLAGLIGAAMVLLDALAAVNGAARGWLPVLAFHAEGAAAFEYYDLVLAAVWGLTLGIVQFLLTPPRTPRAYGWPVATCLGLLAGAALGDVAFSVLRSTEAAGLVAPGLMTLPAQEAVMWALIGAGMGFAQWPLLQGGLRGAGWWLLLAIVGPLAGWAATVLFVPNDWLLLGALAAGAASAVPLWLATRRDFGQARWLPAWEAVVWGAVVLLIAPFGLQLWTAAPALPLGLAAAWALMPGLVLSYQG